MIEPLNTVLNTIYEGLGYNTSDALLGFGNLKNLPEEKYLSIGSWLELANEVEADKIFFVENNPVIVFAEADTIDQIQLAEKYRKIWSMARPRLLFISLPGEIQVYDLETPPMKHEEWGNMQVDRYKYTVIQSVIKRLQKYSRTKIESGKLFEEHSFESRNKRADKALIQDLKIVRRALIEEGSLKVEFAHSLIGRSIFIRYLEDRDVITKEYYNDFLVGQNSTNIPQNINPDFEGSTYISLLSDHESTYRFFTKLNGDFNGDIFPNIQEESKHVKLAHLDLLKRMFIGNTSDQLKIFLWAYDFKVIPIEIISSIYEEFYQSSLTEKDNKGTHYTPPVLVDFVISKTLTPEILKQKPKILDPACGSAIFLVESYKRIIRWYSIENGKKPSNVELRTILQTQIMGIEVNPEAIRVAAFSLYLAMLHYMEPPDILQQIKKGEKLPYLIYTDERDTSKVYFDILLKKNAFESFTSPESNTIAGFVKPGSIDVIVGNPPWGQPQKNDAEGRKLAQPGLDWCQKEHYPVGDNERSQVFIWLSIHLLKKGGIAGLLVSTGVFFKNHEKSKDFRKKWLSLTTINEVFNFSHVRDIFFKKSGNSAIAPFAFVNFRNVPLNTNPMNMLRYWSVKKTFTSVNLEAIVLRNRDRKIIGQNEISSNEHIWKTLWWGNYQDFQLIKYLDTFTKLKDFYNPEKSGHGFIESNKEYDSEWLLNYKELPSKSYVSFGKINFAKTLIKVPPRVYRRGQSKYVYEGTRLIIKRGVSDRIVARLESDNFCFRHSTYAIHLQNEKQNDYKIILAILWSSVCRYYQFMTSSNWGNWHFEIQLGEMISSPIILDIDDCLKKEIIKVVDSLRNLGKDSPDLFTKAQPAPAMKGYETIDDLEKRLDVAVYELFKIPPSFQDLINDFSIFGLDAFYNPLRGIGTLKVERFLRKNSGSYKDLTSIDPESGKIEAYLKCFLQVWHSKLPVNTDLFWQVIDGLKDIISVEISLLELVSDSNLHSDDGNLIAMNPKDLLFNYYSEKSYIEDQVITVSPDKLTITKPNEQKLWTKSIAREDAESSMVKMMNLKSAPSN